MATITTPKFNFSFGELIIVSEAVFGFAARDMAEFEKYGMDMSYLSAFNDMIIAFRELPGDAESEALIREGTRNKDIGVEQVLVFVREIDVRAKMLYSSKPNIYSAYHIKDISKLSAVELMSAARNLSKAVSARLSEFETVGWTNAKGIEFLNAINNLDSALVMQRDYLRRRAEATRVRTEKANELYDKLSLMCGVGKTIWNGVNEAYYNDYVIDPASASSLRPPSALTYNSFEREFNWPHVPMVDSYELQAKYPESSDYITIYSGQNTFHGTEIPEGSTNCRIRSYKSDVGESVWSSIFTFENVPPSAPANLQLNSLSSDFKQDMVWNPVSGNVKYKVYHSAVAPGLPPGSWNPIGTLEGTNFTTAPLGPALRHYFKVQAWNGIFESGPSNIAFVEIPI